MYSYRRERPSQKKSQLLAAVELLQKSREHFHLRVLRAVELHVAHQIQAYLRNIITLYILCTTVPGTMVSFGLRVVGVILPSCFARFWPKTPFLSFFLSFFFKVLYLVIKKYMSSSIRRNTCCIPPLQPCDTPRDFSSQPHPSGGGGLLD